MKIVEGTVANVPPQGGRKHPNQDFIPINTSNILFICGGAFEGMDKIISSRMEQKSIGFGANIKPSKSVDRYKIYKNVLPQDLVKFGLIPEFVGRMPIIATLDTLDKKALIDIMTKPKNALVKQYKKLMKYDDIDLVFKDDAIEEMCDKAIKQKTGARGLRSIMEETMRDVMYNVPSEKDKYNKCIITKQSVIGTEKPILEFDKSLEKKAKNTNKKETA